MLKVLKDMLKLPSPNIFTIWYFALMFVQNMFEHVLIVSKSHQPPQNLAPFEVAFLEKYISGGVGWAQLVVWGCIGLCATNILSVRGLLSEETRSWRRRSTCDTPGTSQAPHNVKSGKELENNNINSQQPTWTQTSLNYWKESTRRFQKRNPLDQQPLLNNRARQEHKKESTQHIIQPN